MSTVLDASAIIALAIDDAARSGGVESAIDNEVCYMSPVAVAEVHLWLLNHVGRQAAAHWLGFVMSGSDVLVDSEVDQDFIELVSEARIFASASPSTAFTAALARRHLVAVTTSSMDFAELERLGFCQVRWL